jgi:hypothetical protein
MWIRVLEKCTGEGLETWNRRIRTERISDPGSLRAWLEARGVTGYAQRLLVMERFGYPDFLRPAGEELIDAQYADRPQLRPVFDAIVTAAQGLGDVALEARKTYVSLESPRGPFARVQPTTRDRVDLGLRLDGRKPAGRLRPSRMHPRLTVQVSLRAPSDVDTRVRSWLRRAYLEYR